MTEIKGAYYAGTESMHVDACRPVDPAAGEVQLRVSHCGICGTDLHIFLGHMNHRVKTPQVIGHEMSGTAVAAGDGVGGYRASGPATLRPLDPCGRGPARQASNGPGRQNLQIIACAAPGPPAALRTVPPQTPH